MRLYTLLAAAKINLYLEIIGDRPDGFHELVMVMQSVDLADQVTVRSIGTDDIRLRCDHPEVPTDDTNLAYRAAALLAEAYPNGMMQHGGVEITLDKRIPVGAGLAGGSADAAAVLVGLDLLWQLGLTQGELKQLGAQLGSDIPFCIAGGTALATGRGETTDPLPCQGDGLHVVLAKYRSLLVSTPWAYKTYRQAYSGEYVNDAEAVSDRQRQVQSGAVVQALALGQPEALGQALHNDLEKAVLPAHPQVVALKAAMAAAGGLGTLMSGSGPTVFTLATTQAEAEAIQAKVRSQLPDPDLELWVARFAPSGVQLTP